MSRVPFNSLDDLARSNESPLAILQTIYSDYLAGYSLSEGQLAFLLDHTVAMANAWQKPNSDDERVIVDNYMNGEYS